MFDKLLTSVLGPKLKEIKNAIKSIASSHNYSNAVIMIYNVKNEDTQEEEAVIQFMGVGDDGEMVPLHDKDSGQPLIHSIVDLPKILS